MDDDERQVRPTLYMTRGTALGFSPFPEAGVLQCSVPVQRPRSPRTKIPQLGPVDGIVQDLNSYVSGFADVWDARLREAMRRQEQRAHILDLFLESIGAVRREDWGSRTPKYAVMDVDWDYNTVVIHHSGDGGETDPRGIENEHMAKWDDVGYHFMVNRGGTIYEGRRLLYKGSHTAGANTGKVGILVMGDFEHQWWDDDDDLSSTQLGSAETLISRLKDLFPTLVTLGGHRDWVGTSECPGGVLYDYLSTMRGNVALNAP
jgi:N-acetylmuramoyl-L-alanine amidase